MPKVQSQLGSWLGSASKIDTIMEYAMSDGESFTFYSVSWHHARLQRQCCECNILIERKERYQRLSGYCDEKWRNYSTCHECAKTREEFLREEFTMTRMLDDLMEKRDGLSYDDAHNWAMLTNAIASVRCRMRAAAKYAGPTLTPLPLRAKRAVPDGFAP